MEEKWHLLSIMTGKKSSAIIKSAKIATLSAGNSAIEERVTEKGIAIWEIRMKSGPVAILSNFRVGLQSYSS
jgi:hypothetical protein